MGEEVAVSLKKVSKCFKRYAQPVDRLKEVLRLGGGRPQEFWAVQDIDLEIARGETLGIIGRNGSGKSTLLQMIAGTITPTSGEVKVNGRVSALLELGSGFNPEFTGRQNVFFNARILGLSREEIAGKFEQIAVFADIGDFIDQPVKTYSSGMFVRLAFAVAIHVEPEILIIDEALSVGDIFFQQKCFKFLEGLRSQGKSIIFVSHDTQSVIKLCDRAVVLHHGVLKYAGSPAEMVAKYTKLYYSQFLEDVPEELQVAAIEPGQENEENGLAKSANTQSSDSDHFPNQFICDFPQSDRYGCLVGLIAGIATTDGSGQPQSVFKIGDELVLSVKINQHPVNICPLNVGFQIKDRFGQILVGTNTCMLSGDIDQDLFGQPFICQFKFSLALLPGQYTIVVAVAEYSRNAEVIYDWIEQVGVIEIFSNGALKQAGLYCPEITLRTG